MDKLCFECEVQMTNKSRHCFICNICVENFDHHCDWFDKCIGIGNLKVFTFFLISLSIYLVFILVLNIDALCFNQGKKSQTQNNWLAFLPENVYKSYVSEGFMAVYSLICLIFSVPLFSLLFIHIKNLR